MPTCLVSLGANLGPRRETLDDAIRRLRSHEAIGSLVESDRLENQAIGGPPGQPPFVNSVARLETSLAPLELLETLQTIERDAQRVRDQRWAARELDLDLLAYGDQVLRLDTLRVPHPRMSFRRFVLAPAAEVAPDWRHPELQTDLADLLRVHREGADTVCVVGPATGDATSAASVSQLVRIELPREVGCVIEGVDAGPTPRLTIDLRDDPSRLCGPRGPRLALADCPREHWRDEVRAAIDCVWPPAAGGVS